MADPLFSQLRDIVRHGGHLCAVCSDAGQRTGVAAQYLHDGLQKGECAIYAADAVAETAIVAALATRGVDVARERARGALFFPNAAATSLQPGGANEFDAGKMLEIFRQKLGEARASGFAGCRFASEPTWAISRSNLVPSLIEFEALLDDFFPSQPACGLCVYDQRAWPAEAIVKILRTHPVAVIDDVVCRNNPFYEPPDLSLATPSDDKRVAWMLDRLRAEHHLDLEFKETQSQLQSELADIERLQSLSAEMVDEKNVESLYQKLMNAAVTIMRSDFASMQMLYGEVANGGRLRLLGSRGFTPEATKFWEWVNAHSTCSCGVALATGRRAIVPDIETCDFIAGTDHLVHYRQTGIRAMQSTPLIARSGALVGVISTHWRNPHQPAERDLRLLDILARQAADLLERKHAEDAQALLTGELNHRVKNTLANIEAIMQHTLRHTQNRDDFAADFSGRIQSMSRIHSLLTDAAWKGADLRDIIRDQLLSGPMDETRLTVWGPVVHLEPQIAQQVAMMLYELGTNSSKHGALSASKGWVAINWIVEGTELRLTWVERGGPSVVSAPTKRGFGTTLIEQSARALGGIARMSSEAEGVSWDITIQIPRDSVSQKLGATSFSVPLTGKGSSREEEHAANASVASLTGKRLLVVEDEPLIAGYLVDSLKEIGAEIVGPAGTVDEALHLIERDSLDAALLDGNLHGKPADDVAAALTRRNVPFIFVTGYGEKGLPHAFGRVGVLSKPFRQKHLFDAVTRLVAPPVDVAS